jgi:hypothetical protein
MLPVAQFDVDPQLRSCTSTAAVLFVHLEDLVGSLTGAMVAALGDALSSLPNLQTLVVRRCGLQSVSTAPAPPPPTHTPCGHPSRSPTRSTKHAA